MEKTTTTKNQLLWSQNCSETGLSMQESQILIATQRGPPEGLRGDNSASIQGVQKRCHIKAPVENKGGLDIDGDSRSNYQGIIERHFSQWIFTHTCGRPIKPRPSWNKGRAGCIKANTPQKGISLDFPLPFCKLTARRLTKESCLHLRSRRDFQWFTDFSETPCDFGYGMHMVCSPL